MIGRAGHYEPICSGPTPGVTRASGLSSPGPLPDDGHAKRSASLDQLSVGIAAAFASPYAGPYLMVLSLTEAGLPIRSGRIDYAPAFTVFG